MDYDSISHALTVSGYWSEAPGAQGWSETIGAREAGTDQVEVGLLGAEQANDPEEIKMGGLLAAIGKDNELSKFSSPSPFKVPLADSWLRAYTLLIPITASPIARRCDVRGFLFGSHRNASYDDYFDGPAGAQGATESARCDLRPACLSDPAVFNIRRQVPAFYHGSVVPQVP